MLGTDFLKPGNHLYLDAQGPTTIPQEPPQEKKQLRLSYKRLKFLTLGPQKWYSGQTYYPLMEPK
jgi:hypothetical protein